MGKCNRSSVLSLTIILFISAISCSQTNKSNYENFDKLKQAFSLLEKESFQNNTNSTAQVILQLKSQAKQDKDVKQHLINEILKYSKRFMTPMKNTKA